MEVPFTFEQSTLDFNNWSTANCSAVKCHEHHEIFTNGNREHIRGSLCSLLILNKSTTWHAEHAMPVLESYAKCTDWHAELNAGASISMTFFWLWTVLPNAIVTVSDTHDWNEAEMISDETQTVGDPIICLMTFYLAPNSWLLIWSRHILSVIITTFLECTWCVVPSSKMRMLSSSVWFDALLGQTERETRLILLLQTTHKHRIPPMTIVKITDWKCCDQVTDQELVAQNVTKHVMVVPICHI